LLITYCLLRDCFIKQFRQVASSLSAMRYPWSVNPSPLPLFLITTHARANAADEESIEHLRSQNQTKVQSSQENLSLVNKA